MPTVRPEIPGTKGSNAVRSAAEAEPVKRVIVASLGTGALLMLILTVVVAAGAPEHTITGMALLGAGAGWATLAVLSRRFTSRAQHWALTPAAAMSLTGVALIVLRPNDAALTVTGWLWPPLLLALTLWTWRESWRHLTGGQRWLIVPVLCALTIASVGGAYETFALATDSSTSNMAGQLHDVGGYRLHLDCTGAGSPTVVLLSGMGEMSPSWIQVTPAVAGSTRVCAYDRAGQIWSDSSPHAPDGIQVARDLHALLDVAEESGPFVLVGHSIGGVYALTFAADYPNEVAGMVLLDSSPSQVELVPSFATTWGIARRVIALLPTAARMGLGDLFLSFALPATAADQVASFSASPRGLTNWRDEQGQVLTAIQQAQTLTTFGHKPLVVLTSLDELTQTPGWGNAQDRLAALSTNSSHGVIDVTHGAMLVEPASVAAAVRAISDVVDSTRTGAPLPGR